MIHLFDIIFNRRHPKTHHSLFLGIIFGALFISLILTILASPRVLTTLVSSSPRSYTIGYSVQGRPIIVKQFGSGLIDVLFVGGLHTGLEENTHKLADLMVDYFTTDPAAIPANITLSIIPTANPDGSALGIHSNANGVDLNRNWPSFNWSSYACHSGTCYQGLGGTAPLSEPETRAFYNFVFQLQPAMSFVWHSQAAVVEDNNTGIAEAAARTYANASGYTLIDRFPEVPGQPITGQFIDAMKEQWVPAGDIELTDHVNTDFSRNLNGVRAALKFISTAPLPAYDIKITGQSCASANSVKVSFSWKKAPSGTIQDQWLDVSTDEFKTFLGTSDPPSNTDTTYATGTGKIGNLVHNKVHWWRLNTLMGGRWYSSVGPIFTTINCTNFK